jgi:hypothetical protein
MVSNTGCRKTFCLPLNCTHWSSVAGFASSLQYPPPIQNLNWNVFSSALILGLSRKFRSVDGIAISGCGGVRDRHTRAGWRNRINGCDSGRVAEPEGRFDRHRF